MRSFFVLPALLVAFVVIAASCGSGVEVTDQDNISVTDVSIFQEEPGVEQDQNQPDSEVAADDDVEVDDAAVSDEITGVADSDDVTETADREDVTEAANAAAAAAANSDDIADAADLTDADDISDAIDAADAAEAVEGDQGGQVAAPAPAAPAAGQVAAPAPAAPATANGLQGADLEAFIASRYEAYWEAFDAARRSPSANPSTGRPALLGLAAGDLLEQSFAQVVALSEAGEALRESAEPSIAGTDSDTEHRVRVELVDGGLATVAACTVADDERYNVATGQTVEQNVLSVESTSTMVIADGEWKIIRAKATSIESGVGGCWLAGDDVYPY